MMIFANAVVDPIFVALPPFKGPSRFRVEVWGREPHDFVRIYEVQAKDDNVAAKEGLRLFVEEIEKLVGPS
jgi:hypothetical protein